MCPRCINLKPQYSRIFAFHKIYSQVGMLVWSFLDVF